MVTLPPMPEDVWDAWCAASIRGYASDMVRVGTWPAEGAEARAESRFARVVPAGRATAGHEFRSIMNDAGETVGALWFAPDGEIGRGTAFIWDIVIRPEYRGRGYGRAAREALEAFVGALGYDAIRLHVFGDNDAAHHLYRSVGYSETDVSMVKRLA
jgi:ribosomal protein S18 acetylase RimI-like enzyme